MPRIPTIDDQDPNGFIVSHGIKQSKDGKIIYIGNSAIPRQEVLRAFAGTLNPGYQAPPQRRFGNPAPLGLCAFALTTFMLSLINMRTRGVHTATVVVGPALFYGGFIQLLAGMWEMAVENTFGATALSSYGGFWMAWSMLASNSFSIRTSYATRTEYEHAVGFFLAGWFIFTSMLTSLTVKSTWPFFLLFFCLSITFALLTCSHFFLQDEHPHEALTNAGGAFGVVTAALAWYNAFAGIAEPSNSFFVPQGWNTPWNAQNDVHVIDDDKVAPIETISCSATPTPQHDFSGLKNVNGYNQQQLNEALSA
eukprot:GDKJ01043061.1.p1 GENE.GDKJ01043061.1~~GDKJ01043061.1.p1  ORF type:complete len:309 (+),score=71.52 GDKJ01043061.1:31-957(+)